MKKILYRIAIVVLLILILIQIAHSALLYLFPRDYDAEVEKYASEHGLDEALIYAIIKCESNFDRNAESTAGAIGLMQITPDTYKWAATKRKIENTNRDDLFDASINIDFGCYIYSMLLDEFKSVKVASAAYNAGRSKVLSWLDDKDFSENGDSLDSIPYPETEIYVKKIERTYKIYKLLYY